MCGPRGARPRPRRRVEPVQQRRAASRRRPSLGTCRVSASSSRVDGGKRSGGRVERPGVGELEADVTRRGSRRLSSSGRALGDQPAAVEHRDPVGELIGLLQVMRGEEDRHAAVHEIADDPPHGAAAARVEAGGRLVEEDDPRIADQGHREVEPAAHAAGVRRGRFAEPPRPGRTARAARRSAVAPSARSRWHRSAISDRFSSPVRSVVHRGELAGDADHVPDGVRLSRRVVAGDAHLSGVGLDQGRQDVHRRGLAGAVRPEQGEDRAGGDAQVDTVERDRVAERLAEARRPRAPALWWPWS